VSATVVLFWCEGPSTERRPGAAHPRVIAGGYLRESAGEPWVRIAIAGAGNPVQYVAASNVELDSRRGRLLRASVDPRVSVRLPAGDGARTRDLLECEVCGDAPTVLRGRVRPRLDALAASDLAGPEWVTAPPGTRVLAVPLRVLHTAT